MPAYEIHGIREDGSTFGSVGFECDTSPEYEADAEGYAVAEHYAKLWTALEDAATVRLYKTPRANMSSVSSINLWPGEMFLITEIHLKLKTPIPPPIEDDVPF
jgi:hypothetical protein